MSLPTSAVHIYSVFPVQMVWGENEAAPGQTEILFQRFLWAVCIYNFIQMFGVFTFNINYISRCTSIISLFFISFTLYFFVHPFLPALGLAILFNSHIFS